MFWWPWHFLGHDSFRNFTNISFVILVRPDQIKLKLSCVVTNQTMHKMLFVAFSDNPDISRFGKDFGFLKSICEILHTLLDDKLCYMLPYHFSWPWSNAKISATLARKWCLCDVFIYFGANFVWVLPTWTWSCAYMLKATFAFLTGVKSLVHGHVQL